MTGREGEARGTQGSPRRGPAPAHLTLGITSVIRCHVTDHPEPHVFAEQAAKEGSAVWLAFTPSQALSLQAPDSLPRASSFSGRWCPGRGFCPWWLRLQVGGRGPCPGHTGFTSASAGGQRGVRTTWIRGVQRQTHVLCRGRSGSRHGDWTVRRCHISRAPFLPWLLPQAPRFCGNSVLFRVVVLRGSKLSPLLYSLCPCCPT